MDGRFSVNYQFTSDINVRPLQHCRHIFNSNYLRSKTSVILIQVLFNYLTISRNRTKADVGEFPIHRLPSMVHKRENANLWFSFNIKPI